MAERLFARLITKVFPGLISRRISDESLQNNTSYCSLIKIERGITCESWGHIVDACAIALDSQALMVLNIPYLLPCEADGAPIIDAHTLHIINLLNMVERRLPPERLPDLYRLAIARHGELAGKDVWLWQAFRSLPVRHISSVNDLSLIIKAVCLLIHLKIDISRRYRRSRLDG